VSTGLELVVIGAGPVGLAFALGAARLRGAHVTVLERQTLASTGLPEPFDHRVYALSPGTRKFLESIEVWQRLAPARVEPVRGIEVWGDALQAGNHLVFEEPTPLAYIVEHAALMDALLAVAQAVEETTGALSLVERAAVVSMPLTGSTRHVQLADGSVIDADLVIGADGGQSQSRALADIDAETHDYEADAVVANFVAAKPHGGVARQWFAPGEVLAYLPLPAQHISIVWSVPRQRADALMAMDAEALSAAVAHAGCDCLGALQLRSPVARFPLKRTLARAWVREGFALIGDAAHAIHPMAGQGANLGFADAAALLDVLRQRSPLSRAGDRLLLRRYARARREDTIAMAAATHGLHALYRSEMGLAKMLRNQGLGWLNRVTIAKSLLTGHAMR
jgi:2-polyprenylphenol 6-hydroxylase